MEHRNRQDPMPVLPSIAAQPHWLDFDFSRHQQILAELGEPSYRAKQIARWIFERFVLDFTAMTDLPKALRTTLAARYRLGSLQLRHRQLASDGTQKFLFELLDGEHIESVLIPAEFQSGGTPSG